MKNVTKEERRELKKLMKKLTSINGNKRLEAMVFNFIAAIEERNEKAKRKQQEITMSDFVSFSPVRTESSINEVNLDENVDP